MMSMALLREFDLDTIRTGGDLAPIGELCSLLEELGRESTTPPKLARWCQAAVILCDWLILADEEESAAGRAVLVELATSLSDKNEDAIEHSGNQLLLFLRNTLPAESLTAFSPPENTSSSAPPTPTVQRSSGFVPPVQDHLVISSSEDLIIYNEFISESTEHLESIELKVLDLELQPGNADIINAIFRPIHSIKGAAGFLGLSTTNALCHELETMLDRARKLTLIVTQGIIDTILAGVDLQKQLLANLAMLIDAHTSASEAPRLNAVNIEPVIMAIHNHLTTPAMTPAFSGDLQSDRSKLGGELVAGGYVSEDELSRALLEQARPIGKILVDMGAVASETVESVATARSQTAKQAAAIKVGTEKLDLLMDMVGELVIAQSLVQQRSSAALGKDQVMRKNIEELSKITRNLQDMVMSIRMIPLRQTFFKMQRLVRDTAKKTGKEVILDISGEETEIDKTVIDEIADPMVHLLRNAVDHGITPPDKRIAQGKPAEGRVTLKAFHQGGNVVIEVSDDGQGLDRDRILEKAIEKGLVQPDRQDLSESEVFSFIMAPGFSTAAVTTDISGRGVGMDVVKRNIEGLGGRLDIRSIKGQGTTFTIRLPLTMAIADGMLVGVGQERFVIPTLSIEESLRPSAEMVTEVKNRGMVVMVRNQLIPLVDLCELFTGKKNQARVTESLVIVVSFNEQRIGLVVNSLLGQQQVVIKSLGDNLRGVKGVSGGCILGDGQIALILDIDGVVNLARHG